MIWSSNLIFLLSVRMTVQIDLFNDIFNVFIGDVFKPSKGPSITDNNVRFLLYNKTTGSKSPVSFNESYQGFVGESKMFVYIIHGWLGNIEKQWFAEMTEEYLKKDDFQVVHVDWSFHAWQHYADAVENAKELGKILARHLVSSRLETLSNVHLIGHSLGAHAAGFAGKYLQSMGIRKKIGRITGLDPAGPLFEGTAHDGHLNFLDADFVDCYHTDSGVAGVFSADCTIDFYPNGGTFQPGCPIVTIIGNISITETIIPFIFCSHARSIHYFVESINSEKFVAKRCDSYLMYIFNYCASNPTITFGHNVPRSAKSVYYISTNWASPFAIDDSNKTTNSYRFDYVFIY